MDLWWGIPSATTSDNPAMVLVLWLDRISIVAVSMVTTHKTENQSLESLQMKCWLNDRSLRVYEKSEVFELLKFAVNSPVTQSVQPPFCTGLPPYIVLVLLGQYNYNVLALPGGSTSTM